MNIYLPSFLKVDFKEKLQTPFPFYFNDIGKNVLMILSLSIFLILFMATFNINGALKTEKILTAAVLIFIILTFHIIVIPKLFPVVFDAVHWTLGKYIIFTTWQLVIIGALIGCTMHWLYPHPGITVWAATARTYRLLVPYSIVPLAVLTMLLQNTMLRRSLKDAIIANQELEKIKTFKDKEPRVSHTNVITIYSDTSETFCLNLPELLFVEANDNYSTFVWKQGASIQKKLLRINLKNVKQQLNNSFTLRCHRSFIVNVNAISHITGNASGYKLNIRDTDFAIPVSRPQGKEVIEKIKQLLNAIELY